MSYREQVAAEVRAEMARQRKTGRELASLLSITQQSASRRLNASTDLSLDELDIIARWLAKPIQYFLDSARESQADAS